MIYVWQAASWERKPTVAWIRCFLACFEMILAKYIFVSAPFFARVGLQGFGCSPNDFRNDLLVKMYFPLPSLLGIVAVCLFPHDFDQMSLCVRHFC